MPLEQRKQIFQINVTELKIPTGGMQTSWLFTKRDRGLELGTHHHHHRSLLSSWRMGPLILFLQATLSLAATSACLQVLNPRCSLSLFTVLRHVFLGRPFLRLPSGAHVSAILGFCLMAFLKHGLTTSNVWFLLAHQLSLYLTFLLSPCC